MVFTAAIQGNKERNSRIETAMPADFNARIDEWREQLLDLSKRNRLINCRIGSRGGAIRLEHPGLEAVWKRLVLDNKKLTFVWRRDLLDTEPAEEVGQLSLLDDNGAGDVDGKQGERSEFEQCLESPRLLTNHLLTQMPDKSLGSRLYRLYLNARTSLTEQGINNLFLAFGLLRWYESVDSEKAILSPLALVPVQLTRANADSPWVLSLYEEEVVPNYSLAQILASSFALELPPASDDDLLDAKGALGKYFTDVLHAVKHQERWQIVKEVVLGTFSFQKVAMWKDLDRNRERILAHDVCRAIAGGEDIELADTSDLFSPSEFDDRVSPSDVHNILDCDSSQLEAILAAKSGINLVLDGPPGTGKSQTIANIIAEFLADGKTVLFVSEKAAALEVVKRRLDSRNLGDFCLECHSHKANKREIIKELGRCLELDPEEYRDDSKNLEQLRRQRATLNAYVRALHTPVSALKITPYQAHGRLAADSDAKRSQFTIPDVLAINQSRFQELSDAVTRLAACRRVVENHSSHPWRGCRVEGHSLTILDDIASHCQDIIQELARVLKGVEDLQILGILGEQPTREDIENAIGTAREATTTYPSIPSSWFTSDPKAVAETIIKMAQDAASCRDPRNVLSRFRSEVLEEENTAAVLGAFGWKETQAWKNWLSLSSPTSVKKLRGQLHALADDLRFFSEELDACQDAVDGVIRVLPLRARPMKLLPTLTTVARCVADIEKARPSWFVPEKRQELKAVAARCVEELAGIEKARALLSNRFEQKAFEPESASIVADAKRHQPAWERYTAFRNQFAGFYIEEPPRSMKQILKDMRQFREYAARTARLNDVAAEDRDILLFSKMGGPDWKSMADIAGAIGKLRGMMKFPDRLQTLADHRLCERLLAVATNCKAATERTTQMRSDLLRSFWPIAFDALGREKVEELGKYERFWQRWSGGWQEYRRQVTELFFADIPRSGRRLVASLKQLRDYHRRCMSVESAEQEYSEVLPYSASGTVDWDVLLQALDAVRKLKSQLASSQKVKDWLEGAKFAELEDLIARRRADEGTVCKLRESLGHRFSQDALDGCDRELAHRIRKHVRFLKHWRSFRSQVVSKLYASEPPKSSRRVFEDIADLDAYHAAALRLRQTSQQYADATLSEHADIADWRAIAQRLDSVEQLCSHIKVPESLVRLLSRPTGIDRQALTASADTLDSALASVREDVRVFCDRFNSVPIANRLRHYTDVDLETLRKLTRENIERISRELPILGGIVGLLREDADLFINDVGDCSKRIAALRKRAHTRAKRLEGIVDLNVAPLSYDWSEEAQKARWLLAFLGQHDGSPPNWIVQIVTDQGERIATTKAVHQAEEAILGRFRDLWQYLGQLFSLTEDVSTGIRIESTPLAHLLQWLKDRSADVERLYEWTEFRDIEETLRRHGVSRLLDEVTAGKITADEAPQAFEARFFRLWLDAAYRKDDTLRQFDSNKHARVVQRFRKMDRRMIQEGYKRIRTRLLQNPDRPHLGLLNAPPSSETGVLLREVNKKRRHLSLRQLFRRIPRLLTRLKPCIMMSPLSASTYLNSDQITFDLVIFDEASQVRPYDAIGAIYRGKQLLVAGDQKQLPPTSFFDRLSTDEGSGEDDDDYSDSIADFENILDVCCTRGMPRKRLRWHYRSRRESLIAFSNRHYYNNALITFPSVHDAPEETAVRQEFVPQGRWLGGTSGGYNPVEAKRVAELVMDHFRNNPHRSLGVVAFNRRQHLAILDELERLRREYPDIEPFFDETGEEPFFVKNLENVQGDERDVIMISVGYGHDADGKFAMRFGPLNRQGGERRLNVIVTRAKYEVILVSSIRAHDIDLGRTQSVGVRLLKSYLEYAERGVETLAQDTPGESDDEYDSLFEMEVAKELRARGLTVETQVGCAAYRIDLALVDPNRLGRYVLAVECDGATYHSSVTARDRDRLRQEVLEKLGWTIVRVWSTDWVRDPKRQIERVLNAYKRALRSFTEDHKEESPRPMPESREVQERVVTKPHHAAPSNDVHEYDYESIEDVPDNIISSLAIDLLRKHGATDEGDLVKAIARSLGFRRTGNHIRQRIETCMERLKDSNTLKRTDEGFVATSEEAH